MKIRHFFRSDLKYTAKCSIYMSPQVFLFIHESEMQVPVLVLAIRHLLSVPYLKDNRRSYAADLFLQEVSVSAAPKMSNGWRFII